MFNHLRICFRRGENVFYVEKVLYLKKNVLGAEKKFRHGENALNVENFTAVNFF